MFGEMHIPNEASMPTYFEFHVPETVASHSLPKLMNRRR